MSQDASKEPLTKQQVYDAERTKLLAIFAEVEQAKRQLVEGLIEDAAYLKAENWHLRQGLAVTGMVKVHPQYAEMQKPIEAAKQYRQNVNSYAVVIKTLNGVLNKNPLDDEDDPLGEYDDDRV
jgi:regulator of replication initiation timing